MLEIMKLKFIFLLLSCCALYYSQDKLNNLNGFSYQELQNKFYDTKTNDVEEKKSIAKYYLKKAKFEKKKEQIAEGYVMLHFDETFPNALKYLDSLQFLTKASKENYYPARTYLLKGNLYFKYDNYQAALNNYILGLEYAKKKKNKRQIAMADLGIAYLNNYIGKHGETVKTLKYYLYNADYLNAGELNSIKLNLADAFIEINKTDSAKILIQEGLQFSKKTNDTFGYYQNLGMLGYYNLKLKKYQSAVNNLLNCQKYFFSQSYQSKRSQTYTLLNLGKSYAGLGEKEKAIKSFATIDSIVNKTNFIFPELRDVYTYLIDYYKENKDREKQLYYVDRFLKVDNELDSRFRYISRELPRRYDTPKLLQEKEIINSELKKRKFFLYVSICILIVIIILFINFYFKHKKTVIKYKQIAQDLIHSIEKKNRTLIETKKTVSNISIEIENESKANKIISEDIASSILKELGIFETKELFLKKGITLSSLAKQIKTNTTYLSDVINTHKGRNFATYLNDLRIDYALDRLVKDKKFRSYKLVVIAEELGYNNEQAFAIAFKRKTGTTLSIYIKEIEKTGTL